MKLNELLEISQELGVKEVAKELENLDKKVQNQELNVVVVGDFSAGKSSLINAIFRVDLPTNVLPETATIWKVKSCKDDVEEFKIYFKNGDVKEIEKIEEVKSFDAKEIKLVELCIQSDFSVNIIDTPGLSSLDEFHEQALLGYLNEADVIIVAADINQGLTKSTKEFLEKNSSTSQKTYIVLTKSDLKPEGEIAKQKEYILKNYEGFEKVVAVSKDDVSEIREVLEEIEKNKLGIIEKRVEEKANEYCLMLKNILKDMMSIDMSDVEELKAKKEETEKELDEVLALISEEESKFSSDIDNLSYKMTKVVIDELSLQKEWIVEGLYDDNLDESIEDRLNKVVKDGIEKSIVVLEDKINKISDKIKNLSIKFEFNDLSIVIVDKLVRFREMIVGAVEMLLRKHSKIAPIASVGTSNDTILGAWGL